MLSKISRIVAFFLGWFIIQKDTAFARWYGNDTFIVQYWAGKRLHLGYNWLLLLRGNTLKAEMEQQKQKNEELEKKLQETATLQARDSHESDAGWFLRGA